MITCIEFRYHHWNHTIPSLNNLLEIYDITSTEKYGAIIVTLWMGIVRTQDKA